MSAGNHYTAAPQGSHRARVAWGPAGAGTVFLTPGKGHGRRETLDFILSSGSGLVAIQ